MSGRWILFQRLTMMTGMVFSPEAKKRFKGITRWNAITPIDFLDLKSIGERVKFMDVVDVAQASFFEVRGLIAEKRSLFTDQMAVEELFNSSLQKFETALISAPNNCETLFSCARVALKVLLLKARATRERIDQIDSNLCDMIGLWLKYSNDLRPQDPRVLLLFAQYYEQVGKVKEAEERYLDCLEIDPQNMNALVAYGNFLLATGREDPGKDVLNLAGTGPTKPRSPHSGSFTDTTPEENKVSIRVYLEDGTYKTVSTATAASAEEIRTAALREIIHHTNKYFQTTDAQLATLSASYNLFQLHEICKAQNISRLIPADERPWITVLQRPGNKSSLALKCPTIRTIDSLVECVPLGLLSPYAESNNFVLRLRYSFTQLALTDILEQIKMTLIDVENLEIFKDVRSQMSDAFLGKFPFRNSLRRPRNHSKLPWMVAHITESFRLIMLIISAISKECQCEKLSASSTVHFPWDSNNVSKKATIQQVDVSAPTYYDYFISWAISELTTLYTPIIKDKKLPKDISKNAVARAAILVARLHKIVSHLVFRHWNFVQTFLFNDLLSSAYLHLYWLTVDFELIDPRKSPEIFSPLTTFFREASDRESAFLSQVATTPSTPK
jgi:tetratricopeptide (TPR) repeat protein